MKIFCTSYRWSDSPWLPSLLLMAIAFLAYANTYGHPWIYDDLPVIVNNPDITSWQAFLQDSYSGRPLRELSYLLDYNLFGLEPAGWHIQNNFWHGLNGILLFLLARHLFKASLPAFLAGLLFLLHPLQVEVVAHLSHRKDLLATTFILGSLLAYVMSFSASGWKRWGWLALTVLLAGFAYAGKQTAAALPVVLFAYELAFVPPAKRLLLRWPALVYSAGALLTIAASVWMFSFGGLTAYRQAYLPLLVKLNQMPPFTDAGYLQMVFKSWAFMLRRIVWPVDLAPEYVFTAPGSWFDPWVLAGLALAVLTMAAIFSLFATGQKLYGFALVWFAAFFLITANLFWPLAYLAADRYLYTSLVGVCLICSWFLWRVLRQNTALLLPIGTVVCLLLALLTWQQNKLWSSYQNLWQHAWQVSPESFVILNNLGKGFMDQGDDKTAIIYYQRAAEVNSSAAAPRYNLGHLYDKQGNRFLALFYFKEYLNRADISSNIADHRQAEKVRNYVRKKYAVNL